MSTSRLSSLVVAALVGAGLTALPALAPPAEAAVQSGPTAVAIDRNGTTYAGTAAGGELTVIDATGAVVDPVVLPRSGPVDGIAVAPDGDLWVSFGYGASKVDPTTGAEHAYIDGSNPPTTECPATDADDPGVYGGVVATATEVVLAHRCGSSIGLNVYRFVSGSWQAMGGASPVGGGRFGDIAYGPRDQGQANAYYLAVPDQAKVEVRAGFDNVHETPIRTVTISPVGGGVTPRPTGVAVDDQGQLFVADAANHVVYVYNHGGQEYDRYIGNPPDPDDYLGGFDTPSSIAQYPRNGSVSELQGNLYVADSGNDRVERLNTYGYTFWEAPTDGSPSTPDSAPINRTLPTVLGTPSPGETLSCDLGYWDGLPTAFLVGWNRDGRAIGGEDQPTYVVDGGDAGHSLSCFVRAVNDAGTSDYATSANVSVGSGPASPTAPSNRIAPTIAGTPQPGQTLTCLNGAWSGSPAPRFVRQWLLDGSPIDGAASSTYTVLDTDLGHDLSCTVTADNGEGTASATSPRVTVTAVAPPTGCPGPEATVSIDGAAEYTDTPAVTLTIRPPAGATQVLISNDGGFDTAVVRALDPDCGYPWTLAVGGGRATKNVYVRFAGGGVDELLTQTDSIVLDEAAPVVTSPRIALTDKRRQLFRVSLRATDAVSGVARVQYAARRGARGTTTRYRGSFTTHRPDQYAWVRVFDRAGNVSAWRHAVRVRSAHHQHR